jgi:two-component system nitrogen regulation sensor histidine kinase NtrY
MSDETNGPEPSGPPAAERPRESAPSVPGSVPLPPKIPEDSLRFGRFERRVLVAMAAVAFVPLLAALLLGRSALREAYEVGVNRRVLGELESSLELYQEHFQTLRQAADRTASLVARDHALVAAAREGDRARVAEILAADLELLPDVAHVDVTDAAGTTLGSVDRPIDEDTLRPLSLTREIEGEPPLVVHVTVTTPWAPFRDRQRAGELVETYSRLESQASYVSSFYLFAYIALLLAVIVIALALGIVVARRVTRRVVVLAEATRRVGQGDLTIEIPTDEKDEVAELTHAFNAMVRDIRASRDRIEYLQRIGAWQEIARRLAHEIKNPLTPIQLAVQEVHKKYAGDDPRFRRTLDDAKSIVEEEVRTLRRLVSEFSEFARLPVPAVAPAELGGLVREWTRTMDPAALALESQRGDAKKLANIELDTNVASEPLDVMLDPMMLRRSLDNLVRNAVQAIADKGEGGHVIVEAHRDGDDAVLEVRDDGPGVPAKSRERVFDPYFTTKTEGTGLGLAIVKKVVLEHGGSIACGVAKEGGAAFRIRLPLRRAGRRQDER